MEVAEPGRMRRPAKALDIERCLEGSNPSLHAKCFHSIVDSTAVYGTAELSSSLSGNTNSIVRTLESLIPSKVFYIQS